VRDDKIHLVLSVPAKPFLHLIDVLDTSIYPIVVGRGKPFLREGQNVNLRLVTTKSFSKAIVKLTYEPQP
jgi:dihydrofolate reductase